MAIATQSTPAGMDTPPRDGIYGDVLTASTRSAATSSIDPVLVAHLLKMLLQQPTNGAAPQPGRYVPVRGALATWQEARAKALVDEHLAEGMPLARLAAACKLSTSAFARGFRISVGIAPHEWLLRRRIERAVALMADGSMTLADVALAAGFSDQSHFTRAFAKRVGVTPGAWRRSVAHQGVHNATRLSASRGPS